MKQRLFLFTLILAYLIPFSSNSKTIFSVAKDKAAPSTPYKKVMILILPVGVSNSFFLENYLVEDFKKASSAEILTSGETIPENVNLSEGQINQKLLKEGVEAILFLSLADLRDDVGTRLSPNYGGLFGNVNGRPFYLTTTTFNRVEVTTSNFEYNLGLIDFNSKKTVWNGTVIISGKDIDKMRKELAKRVVADLLSENLISKHH